LSGERAGEVGPRREGSAALGQGRRTQDRQTRLGACHRGGEDSSAVAVSAITPGCRPQLGAAIMVNAMTAPSRATWPVLSDDRLLSQCEVDTYRASGPGGQKRNKTSSAVRLRHPPSGLIVIAEESRSQHENRARALKRLRQALYLKLREELLPGTVAGH